MKLTASEILLNKNQNPVWMEYVQKATIFLGQALFLNVRIKSESIKLKISILCEENSIFITAENIKWKITECV